MSSDDDDERSSDIADAASSQHNDRNTNSCSSKGYRILIVSDFFYPRLGGVELHQYQLAEALQRRGHRVTILTGTYTKPNAKYDQARQGIRYLSCGLKIYYAPLHSFIQQASLPALFTSLPLLRHIILRERIQLIHVHQATSALAHETLLHAATFNIPSLYTDHSLFGFASVASLHLNKLLSFSLRNVAACIAVSHTARENLVLRSGIDVHKTYVIPNAVDAAVFRPLTDEEWQQQYDERLAQEHEALQQQHIQQLGIRLKLSQLPHKPPLRIIVLSRLVYRKGMDLLAEILPKICSKHHDIEFLIGGDGPKRLLLDEVCERHALQSRIHFLGAIAHSDVRSVLCKGDLFLNCSLTEAFCIALLEAVACGLHTVSTRVGGVSEILPEGDLIRFAEPRADDVVRVLSHAIQHVQKHGVDRHAQHAAVAQMYSWHSVAQRTEVVYRTVLQRQQNKMKQIHNLLQQQESATSSAMNSGKSAIDGHTSDTIPASGFELPRTARLHLLRDRLAHYAGCGPVSGILFACVSLIDYALWRLCERLWPHVEQAQMMPLPVRPD
jgi:phosphatidylinositol N-acetylglucosaminyltransferase subunit A